MKKLEYYCILIISIMVFLGFAKSDLAKDRAQCASNLVSLATCLPYVGGTAKLPTPDCCTGLKQVLSKSSECLCILVRDRNDPSLGLNINATLALSLPDKCHAPANVSDCPAILHLAPNSPDAKVFDDFAKAAKPSIANSTAEVKGNSSAKTTSAEGKSDGVRGSWLEMEMTLGIAITVAYQLYYI